MMTSNILLEVSHLYKTFKSSDTPALVDISLNLKKGERAALIGSDGSGKTTFLRLLSGLFVSDLACTSKKGKTGRTPDDILIDGLSPFKNRNEVKKIIGYMPQKFGLYEDLTVIENLEFYAGLKNINKLERSVLFDELLEFAGLINFKTRLAGALSGGMKQKLGLSCVLLSKPKILLLDEPSVGVDPVSRRDLIQITDKLSKENNIGIIWATSYLDEAKYFDKVFLLQSGKKIYDGNVQNAAHALEGLVYYTKSNDNRDFLYKINSSAKGVADATIEGDKIRIVFETKEAAQDFKYEKTLTEPIFEDFVMSALEGPQIKSSGRMAVPKEDFIAIKAENLSKTYKTKSGLFEAAKNINIEVKKGEIFGLLGPNGAGKSTTFKMLTGLIRPSSGHSSVMGYDINKNPIEAKKSFGYMAQKFSLFGNLSVRQNINFFKGVFNVKNLSAEEIAHEYELEKYLEYNADSLPLGFKQRLSLLCAVIHKPSVLFLDEPTSGVDPVSRREFWIRINELTRLGTTILVTTHFMDEAQFCDRIALVYKGQILIEDTPDNLKNSVKTPENQAPTMEDAFIKIIERANGEY